MNALFINHENEFKADFALFIRQLNTLVEQTLLQYMGQNFADDQSKQHLIMELSELLYNEFTFFKLMSNAEIIAEKEIN